MKQIIAILCILVTPVLLGARPLGIAQSRGEFTINRGSEKLHPGSGEESIVHNSDMLTAEAEPVLLNTTSKSNLFIGSGSSVSLESNQSISLENGQIAVGFPVEAPVSVKFQNLEIITQASEASAKSGTQIRPIAGKSGSSLLVEGLEKNRISVLGLGETFIIRNLDGGEQVAVIPSGDLVQLVRDASGMWKPSAVETFNVAENGVNTNNLKRIVESADDRRLIFFWPAAAGGAAVLGTAGALYYEKDDDEDDRNNRDDRDETSPF